MICKAYWILKLELYGVALQHTKVSDAVTHALIS